MVSTILVVEDDPMERSMLRMIFESAGHYVVEAPHGQAALDAMRPDPLPDVVTTDLRMPVLGGAEMIERLRSDMRTCAVPIVVVTGATAPAQWLHASGLIQAVVRKPFDIHALVDCIEQFTGGAVDEFRELPPPA